MDSCLTDKEIRSAEMLWDGEPADKQAGALHLLRRHMPGAQHHGEEVVWRYIPGACYSHNGPEVTPWHSVPRHEVMQTDCAAWSWRYVGKLELVAGGK